MSESTLKDIRYLMSRGYKPKTLCDKIIHYLDYIIFFGVPVW